MGRAILGAVIGYLATTVVVMLGMFGTWAALGPAGSMVEGGPYPSTAWLASAMVCGFLAAVAGGCVALKVGRQPLAVKILVGLMLAGGLFFALGAETSYQKRHAKAVELGVLDKDINELTFKDSGTVAKNPTWFNWVIPLVGVAGALVGGRQRQ